MNEVESAEQYVRAHELIESLRAERRPIRDAGSEEDARLSSTAALLHSAAPGAGEVDAGFANRLLAHLEMEQARQATQKAPSVRPAQASAPTPATPATDIASATVRKRPGVTRRGVLLGGLGAAAAALTGAAVTAALESAIESPAPNGPSTALVPEGTGLWVAVAAFDAVPVGAIKRFEAGAVIGYLQHTAGGFVALSGVCTHMACLLQWNGAEKTFDCPCHGGRFLSNGQAAPGGRYAYAPLPPIQTKVENGQVWVYVTGGAASDGYPSTQTPTSSHSYGAAISRPNK